MIRYRWPWGALEFTLQGDRVVEIHLERLPPDGAGLRPVPRQEGPWERSLPLPPSLKEAMQSGERELREGRADAALPRFEEVLAVLDEAPTPPSSRRT